MTALPVDRSRWTLVDWEHRVCADLPQPIPRFTVAKLDELDAPVRRHLLREIAPDAPLTQSVRVRMHGSIKLGRWLPFRARQVLNPHVGFIWAARVAGGHADRSSPQVLTISQHPTYQTFNGKLDCVGLAASSVSDGHADALLADGSVRQSRERQATELQKARLRARAFVRTLYSFKLVSSDLTTLYQHGDQ